MALPVLSSRAVLLIAMLAPPPAAARPKWPDTPLARAEVLALLQTLNAALLSHDSATLVLDDWCARHQLAPPGSRIIAERVRGEDKPVSAEARAALRASPDEAVRYRRVRLRCGPHILSEADNWYVPSRLTAAMNMALDGSDMPFGRVVQPLHFHRHTLSARLLWSPLPEGWDIDAAAAFPRRAGDTLAIPDRLIEHRALLSLPDGTPISEVVETYTADILDFAPPAIGSGGAG